LSARVSWVKCYQLLIKIIAGNSENLPLSPGNKASEAVRGPILSLDLGARRVGVAISDPSLIAITRLPPLRRTNWKQLLRDVDDLIRRFDAQTLVIGFPLSLDGSEGAAATETRRTAQKFALSLELPIYLQDERLTSKEAEERLRASGYRGSDLDERIDSESAAIILQDFLASGQQALQVLRVSD